MASTYIKRDLIAARLYLYIAAFPTDAHNTVTHIRSKV